MTKGNGDMLIGMKAIRQALNDISETTVLKWHREYQLPIKKKGGVWTGSAKKIAKWWEDEFTQ